MPKIDLNPIQMLILYCIFKLFFDYYFYYVFPIYLKLEIFNQESDSTEL